MLSDDDNPLTKQKSKMFFNVVPKNITFHATSPGNTVLNNDIEKTIY